MATGDPLVEGKAASGASLTSLNASNIASGTVPSARMSGTYAIDVIGSGAQLTDVGSFTYNADDYGTHGTQAAITAAIAAAVSGGGGTVFIPAGLWSITETIDIAYPGIWLVGEKGSSVFAGTTMGTILRRTTNFAGATIHINSDTRTVYQCGVKDMDIQCYSATMTNYAHIELDNVTVCCIDNVYIQDGFFGVVVDGGECNNIENCIIQAVYKHSVESTETSLGIYIKGDTPWVNITNTQILGGGSGTVGAPYYAYAYGIMIEAGDVISVADCYIGGCRQANVVVSAYANNQLSGVTFSHCFFDAPNGTYTGGMWTNVYGTFTPFANVFIQGTSGTALFSGITMDYCFFHGTGISAGLHVATGAVVYNITATSCTFAHCLSAGVYILDGDIINIKNCTVLGCNQAGYSGYKGAGVFVQNTNRANIVGNDIGGDWNSATSAVQYYGIYMAGGNDYYTVMSNNCWGNTVGGYITAASNYLVSGNANITDAP